MSVVRLDEDDLDEEDLAILAEVAKKGYYHNRPKSVACAPPKKIDASMPQRIDPVAAPARESNGAVKGRAAFDAFQAKWDRFDNDDYLEAADEELAKETSKGGSADQPQETIQFPSRPLPRLAAEFKVLLAGDSGVGKSALVLRHLTGEFVRKSAPSTSTEVCHLRFWTDCGELGFNVWELGSGTPEQAFYQGQAAIVMFDLASRASWRSVPNWMRHVQRHCDTIPTVLVGNKADVDTVKRGQLDSVRIPYQKQKKLQYYEVSVRNNDNFEKPFLWLARRLTNCASLQFATSFAKWPEAAPEPEA